MMKELKKRAGLSNGKNGAGFTLTEILVVMGLLAIFASFSMFISMDFYRSFSFRAEKNIAVSVLMKARSKALANVGEKTHGVHFESNKYVLFQGTPYDPGDSNNEDIFINPTVSTSGLIEVTFDQLTGRTTLTPPATTLTIISGVKSVVITINEEGRIEW